MSSAQIKIHIAAKESDLERTRCALRYHNDHHNYLISVFEQEIYELNIRLQLAEAEESFVPAEAAAEDTFVPYTAAEAAAEDAEINNFFASNPRAAEWGQRRSEQEDQEQDDPCYHCGRANHSCICASAPADAVDAEPYWGGQEFDGMPKGITVTAKPVLPKRSEGTKLKWVSDTDAETYRVAIAKKDGILEVKVVTDGRGYCHDSTTCKCNPCSEIALSRRLGVGRPPWSNGPPLIKTFFKDETAWRASLPAGGTVTITERQLSDKALRALCLKPLTAITDPGRLKELEERFPGATMVLSTKDRQYEIAYKQDSVYGNIHCEDAHISAPFFASFGPSTNGKPRLMAEWRGLYIDLSHLF